MDVNQKEQAIRLSDFLPYQVTLLAHRVARRTCAIAKQHDGLNLSHWRVLAAIADTPGRTANEVVAITPMDKGIVSRAVKSLIDMNLVSRKASNEDGRIAHLFLTAKGRRRYEAIAAEVSRLDDFLRAALSPEESETLQRALARLIDVVD